jgi:N-acetylneuraminate synthase
MSTFIIAEAGVNHNGDLARALAMIDAARDAGADAIKFQTFSAEKLVSPLAKKADYQARETGAGNQFDMLKALELDDAAHKTLFDACGAAGIEFMSTAFDADAADFLISLGIKRIKVPSGEITNTPFLRHLASKDLPLILSTGMANLEEIDEAIAVIGRAQITILHCTSNYPAAPADVNLRAMTTIGTHTGLPIGYSDHTLGLAVSTAAVALGATMIEKHFTLDRSLPGPDHSASLEPHELSALIQQIRDVEVALGSPEKRPTASELPVRDVARRSVCAATDLAAGHILGAADLVILRPGTGIAPKHHESLSGRSINRGIAAGEPISWDDLN